MGRHRPETGGNLARPRRRTCRYARPLEGRRGMKRLIPITLLLLVAAGAAAWWYGLPEKFGWLPEARREFVLYGNVDIRQVSLGFRVSGRLSELGVDEGDV